MTGRSWTIRHTGSRPPTTNAERQTTTHWSKRSTTVKAWREAFGWLARQAGIPHLDRIGVTVFPLHRDARSPQDAGACAPAAKAAIDGLVDAAVIPDDGPDHVAWVSYQAPIRNAGVDGLELVIEDLG